MRALASVALLLAACASFETKETPLLATGRITSDFGSYSIRRVGLLPIPTEDQGLAGDETLEDAFHAELVSGTHYEIVLLNAQDLLETKSLDLFKRGTYHPETLLDLRRRFDVDAIAVGAVMTRRVVPPQRLGVQLDLVSCETGATIWSASVLLDAADVETRDALEIWSQSHTEMTGGAELVMLSPRRFARFAAWQIAQLL